MSTQTLESGQRVISQKAHPDSSLYTPPYRELLERCYEGVEFPTLSKMQRLASRINDGSTSIFKKNGIKPNFEVAQRLESQLGEVIYTYIKYLRNSQDWSIEPTLDNNPRLLLSRGNLQPIELVELQKLWSRL